MGDIAEIRITPDMLLAGVETYLRWDREKEEIEAMVAAVFYSMIEACEPQVRCE